MATLELTRRQYRPKSYTPTPVIEEEYRFSSETERKIELAMQQIERGECTVLDTEEKFRQYINKMRQV